MEKPTEKKEEVVQEELELEEEEEDNVGVLENDEEVPSQLDFDEDLPLYSQFAGKMDSEYFSKRRNTTKRKRQLVDPVDSEVSDDDVPVLNKRYKKSLLQAERNVQLHNDMLKHQQQQQVKRRRNSPKNNSSILDQMNNFVVPNKGGNSRKASNNSNNKKMEYDQAKENLLRAILNYQDHKKSQIVITI